MLCSTNFLGYLASNYIPNYIAVVFRNLFWITNGSITDRKGGWKYFFWIMFVCGLHSVSLISCILDIDFTEAMTNRVHRVSSKL